MISWRNLQNFQQFYNAGGQVIATGALPTQATEFSHEADMRGVIREIFGAVDKDLSEAS